MKDEQGFSLIEVAIASVITMVGLVFLAGMFTLAMSQNRMVKQHTTTTALAQQKLEGLREREKTEGRFLIPGGQTEVGNLTEAGKVTNYYDSLWVNDAGVPSTDCSGGAVPSYRRYWKVENDPGGSDRAIVIAVRGVALQAARRRGFEERTKTATVGFF